MLENDHRQMVAALVKPGADILKTLTAERLNLVHMAIGVAGEGGELLDAVKKHVIYNKPVDLTNIIEELGDLEFYMEGVRQALAINRQDTLDANIQKLIGGENPRYAEGKYTDAAAQTRADKLSV